MRGFALQSRRLATQLCYSFKTLVALGPCGVSVLLLASASLVQAQPPREPGPFRAPDLVELAVLEPSLRLDIRYATTANFVHRAVYPQARAFLQRPAAEALVRAHRTLGEQGYGLLIFDGYRPWSVTRLFWDLTPPAQRAYVANPREGSKHNRGCAVDLSLFTRADGREVEMPSPYDDLSERAHPDYAGGTAPQRAHRALLRRSMEAEGFTVEPNEWWHFNYKDWKRYPLLDVPFEEIPSPSAHP
jgi:zinc D-Ala-D-Ala dipeptidase